jgi:hypothetical protein
MQVFDASCLAKVVTVESMPVATATILSEGVGSSSGIAILEKDKQYYLTSNASDIKTLLTKLISILTNLTTGLTTLDGKPIGTLTPAPAIGTIITQITASTAELTTLKELLK